MNITRKHSTSINTTYWEMEIKNIINLEIPSLDYY